MFPCLRTLNIVESLETLTCDFLSVFSVRTPFLSMKNVSTVSDAMLFFIVALDCRS